MIATWSSGCADDNMAEEILTDLCDIIPRHPWWQARAELAMAILKSAGVHPPAAILEAGCGWGVNLRALADDGYQVTGLDISRRILERLDHSGARLIEADLTQPLPENASSFDAVLALDVIEHLDDDRAAIRKVAQLTKPGGLAIVSVPALPELYSEFDAVQGHRRRYVPESLQAAFEGSGLQIARMLWWGEWMVPLLRIQRQRGQKQEAMSAAEIYRQYLKLPPWPMTFVLRLAFSFDKLRTLRGHTRTGTSLFAVARRTDRPIPRQQPSAKHPEPW